MTKRSELWIATPHLRPDYRGPVNRAYVPFPDPALSAPMIATLESLATKSPDAIAVDAPGEALSYRNLWQAVCRLRSRIESIAETNAPVAILLPTGAAYVVAVFAILASRRIGLLLDQRYPDDRNAAIVAAAGVDVVLAASEIGDTCAWRDVATVNSAAAFDQAVAADVPAYEPLVLDEPAFILCTSGSTGLPKAIVHSQRTMLHWVRTVADAMHLTPDDRVLSVSSPSNLGGFVALLACALTGASMQMLDVASLGLGVLVNVLQTRPVTILRAAPSFLRSLARVPGAAAATARLRLLQLFGEPLWKADLAELRKILPTGCLIRSTYGSTEASGLSWFAGDPDDYDPLRVATGILMPDTTALVVADDGSLCPPGEPGELVIRSQYNALGEWREGRILGEMFESAPDDSIRTYRTGDIARRIRRARSQGSHAQDQRAARRARRGRARPAAISRGRGSGGLAIRSRGRDQTRRLRSSRRERRARFGEQAEGGPADRPSSLHDSLAHPAPVRHAKAARWEGRWPTIACARGRKRVEWPAAVKLLNMCEQSAAKPPHEL